MRFSQTDPKYAFVKGDSIGALGNYLEVKVPKVSEINVWYKITSKDPRFTTDCRTGEPKPSPKCSPLVRLDGAVRRPMRAPPSSKECECSS